MNAPPVQAAAPAPQALVIDESLATLAASSSPATWQIAAPFKFTTLDGRSALLMGARVGLLRRERHVLSFAAFTRVDAGSTARPDSDGSKRRLDVRYGGLLLGWESDGLGLFQSYGHLLAGGGQARIAQRNTRPLLVLEPELGFTWKLTRQARGLVGLSWRGVWGDLAGRVGQRALDGWGANVGLAVGLYPDPLPAAVRGALETPKAQAPKEETP